MHVQIHSITLIFFSVLLCLCSVRQRTFLFSVQQTKCIHRENQMKIIHTHSNIGSLCSFDMVYYLKLNSCFFWNEMNELQQQKLNDKKATKWHMLHAYGSYYSVAYHLSCRYVHFFMILSLHTVHVCVFMIVIIVDSLVCLVNFILPPSIFFDRLSYSFA